MMKYRAALLVFPVLGLLLATSCGTLSSRDPHPARDVDRTDHHLALSVLNRLRNDDLTGRLAFNATAEDGVVYLYGSVPDQAVRMRVRAVVETTPGVVSMVDRMHPPR